MKCLKYVLLKYIDNNVFRKRQMRISKRYYNIADIPSNAARIMIVRKTFLDITKDLTIETKSDSIVTHLTN